MNITIEDYRLLESELAVARETVTQLTHERDVARNHQAQAEAELEVARNTPGPVEKTRWFGYKTAAHKGAFDMLEVSSWEGVLSKRNWVYTVRFRGMASTVVLSQEEFDQFAIAFETYLNRP